jgi:hypothetical protein
MEGQYDIGEYLVKLSEITIRQKWLLVKTHSILEKNK